MVDDYEMRELPISVKSHPIIPQSGASSHNFTQTWSGKLSHICSFMGSCYYSIRLSHLCGGL